MCTIEKLQFAHQVVKILNVCDLIYIKIRLFINGGSPSLRLQTIDCTALDRWAGMCGEVLGEI